jgi:N-acetyl-anhydromuramyl-L-alanine amidase AmpD
MSQLTDAQAKLRRAWSRRRRALNQRDTPKADSALRVIRRLRASVKALRHGRACRRPNRVYTSSKGWSGRPAIKVNRLVLHSTESGPLSGPAVSNYLAQANTPADVHVVIDTNGDLYRLVPDGRKAWHVANQNFDTLGIEQVGRAIQKGWPEVQLRAVAKQLACWSRKYDVPLRDARKGGRGVVTHSSLGASGGGHVDPGAAYPFARVIALARQYV